MYSGNNLYNPNIWTVVKQTVNKANTTTTVVSSQNLSTFGQSVTFTATVKPSTSGTPTGTINFRDGSAIIGAGTSNSSGQASFTTWTLTVGNHSITAVYKGDSNYKTSTSSVPRGSELSTQ